ncbi:spore germination protein [Paenibacillus glucanolyticus]|jgi:hypothetical protein|uniref:spore germination protein n=1 Tax=Paenibacillus TaxID=44249 RepID=UPI0003E1F170|nr:MULTISPECIES: spore germination protein [Paenibacillus]ANA82682.1 spore gernimation protein GerA [Paenibacillus glucanolyticus]AVV58577.1 spore germination protein [Paenibacillus glucanolyticus]ETT40146.1 GerA spore germination protein [Paenibacillus sp. FSL R5-808]MPY17469.1 spore germination protein [Paenibacillus glucanolyticus]
MKHHKIRNRMLQRQSKASGDEVKSAPDATADEEKADLESLNEESLRAMFSSSADVIITSYPGKDKGAVPVLLLYCEGMINSMVLTQYVLPNLEHKLGDSSEWDELSNMLDTSMEWNRVEQHVEVMKQLFAGRLILFFSTHQCFYSIDIAKMPKRQPEESNTEVAIKGARDGFTEDISTNVALIRKRLRTASLHHEQSVVGVRSQTKVSLLYISDIVRPEFIQEAKKRLDELKVDALVTSGQLEEGICKSSLSLFPLVDYIGRPDFVVECLLRGRFVFLVDGSPMAIIGPCNLIELLKSPEDSYFPFYFVTFERLLRLFGLLIAIFLPGFWIALTSFNMDQLPFPLLATVTNSRFGLPFSGPMEILIMLGMFELFREAGIRLPKAVGQTIAVLGGLIIGDAAIRAGLTSPTMLVVSATTAVATFTLVNQTLSGTVSVIRLYVLAWSSFLGMLGFFMGMMSIIAYLSVLESFGLPYLAPLSPLTPKDVVSAVLKKPWFFSRRRPEMLNPIDGTSKEGDGS